MKNTSVRLLTLLAAAVGAAQLHAETLVTRFTTDPLADGWQAYGNTSLFSWNSTNENLEVNWDSSQPNSYFYHPLGRTLTRADGFLITFKLNLTGVPLMGDFQLALGLVNFSDATSPNFFRGTGLDSPNLAEFDYFVGYYEGNPSTWISAGMTDANTTFSFGSEPNGTPMELGTTYEVILIHRSGSDAISGQVFTNGQIFVTIPLSTPWGSFTDFQLDTLAVASYSDANGYGSIRAYGTVDNFAVASPLPIEGVSMTAPGQVAFTSDAQWVYTLEGSTNLVDWSAVAPAVPGNDAPLTLQDTNAPGDAVFYRVQAALP
jgi:hypothetical protein